MDNSHQLRDKTVCLDLGKAQYVPGVFFDVLHPVLHVFERPKVAHVVGEQNSHRAAVIRAGDRPEPLLPRGVPYLELHAFVFQLHGLYLEIDTDGGDERVRERVIGKTKK